MKRKIMTLEEYLQRPFKTDGNGDEVLISDLWPHLTRLKRREIERKLKKGIVPDIQNYF